VRISRARAAKSQDVSSEAARETRFAGEVAQPLAQDCVVDVEEVNLANSDGSALDRVKSGHGAQQRGLSDARLARDRDVRARGNRDRRVDHQCPSVFVERDVTKTHRCVEGPRQRTFWPVVFERLETLGVSVIGFRTDEFPGFFTTHTGLPVAAVANTAGEIADAFRASRALGRPGALLVVQPPPAAAALDPRLVEEAVAKALTASATAGITGAALTPFLLAEVERATGGRSLAANLALLEANAALAAEVAVALADSR